MGFSDDVFLGAPALHPAEVKTNTVQTSSINPAANGLNFLDIEIPPIYKLINKYIIWGEKIQVLSCLYTKKNNLEYYSTDILFGIDTMYLYNNKGTGPAKGMNKGKPAEMPEMSMPGNKP